MIESEMVWPRCSECGRLSIGGPPIYYHVEPLRPVLTMLLKLAREFDEQTPVGEHFSVVDFVDSLALTLAAGKHVKRAGSRSRSSGRKTQRRSNRDGAAASSAGSLEPRSSVPSGAVRSRARPLSSDGPGIQDRDKNLSE